MTEKMIAEFDRNNAEKLIIDLRRNGGGNSNIHNSLVKSILKHPKINQKGNLFVLMGARTFSAANLFILDLENNSNVITVGEHGRGKPNHYSENHFFNLPNSKIRCSVSELYRIDSRKDDNRIRIEPMIKVSSTFQDFSTNKDAALETALNYKQK
jgi:C-terminal processing protease CtpA/Prc